MDTSDVDIDSLLLQQFSSMATQDRDVLITEFQRLLGNQINDASCAFYLDMNNWNLQDAICSYFEYHSEGAVSQIHRLPQMAVVPQIGNVDQTSHDQQPTLVAPNAALTRVWHITNTGTEAWPPGCSLRRVSGYQLCMAEQIIVDALPPGTSAGVHLNLVGPAVCGTFREQWRMSTLTGAFFGETMWVVLQVMADDMITALSLTLQSVAVTTPPNGTGAATVTLHAAGLDHIQTSQMSRSAPPCLDSVPPPPPPSSAILSPTAAVTTPPENTDNMDMS